MHRKVRAASLIEVVVAMVLMMTIFGVSMVIYVNISGAGFSEQSWKSTLLINEVATRTLKEKSFFDEVVEKDNITIYKKITPYRQMAQVVLLEIEAINQENRKLAHRKQLVRKP
jgi:Tfp pilus assembly protein PilV